MNPVSKNHIILTVLILGIIVWLVLHGKHQQESQLPIVTPGTEQTTTWPSAKVGEEHLDDKSGPYTITAVYPVTSSSTITGAFKSFVQAQIDQFKEDTSWATDPSIAPAEAQDLTLTVEYTEEKNTRADNYVFTVESYTGGAHGLQATKTFTYNETGIPVTLASLFTTGEEGLKTIAPYVQAQLKKNELTDATWVSEGAAPTADNYQNFVVTDTGITFMFDPYQVAAYAAGKQTVAVPLSVFKSIANPELFK
jgi:alpha-glucosidase (family GH31 glycosyl hydrolase)